MFRKIYGPEAGPFGFALLMLDPQRCDPQYDVQPTDYASSASGNRILSGIEYDGYDRPVAYYFTTETGSQGSYQRIPADEIIHGFLPEMVGQKRGLPWMATSLFRMKHLAGFEHAAH